MFPPRMDLELEKLITAGKIGTETGKLLSLLGPGTYCSHKSWGVGQVREWDLVGELMVIDFEGRPRHSMKLEFAAKSLVIVPEEHFLARRAGDLASLKAMAKADPVALVALTLQSFGGSMSLDKFEEALAGTVLAGSEFRSWWNATKRQLRKDKRFVVPSRRSEPLEMRDSDVSQVDVLVADFEGKRDLKEKAKAAGAILAQIEEFKGQDEKLRGVIESINDSAGRAMKMHPLRVVELIVVRDELLEAAKGAAPAQPGTTLADLLVAEKKQLAHIVGGLPVSRARLLLAAFPEAFGQTWTDEALALINRVSGRGVAEIMRFLGEQNRGGEIVEFLRKGVRERNLSPDVIAWILRERNGAAKDVIDDNLAVALMNELEKNHMDEEARKASRLHDILFDDRELLGDLVRNMDLNHVRNFSRRLLMTPVFEELNKRSLLARVIKVHPEVQELVTGKDGTGGREIVDEALIVSWESLNKRKQDLEELIQKRIPENTKEISIAREYGDLRENFEFKAAKQMQAVLMRQKSDWEREIEHARGTDFSEADTSVISIGSIVTLMADNGEGQETFTLLGAWDGNPEKGILAYLSDVGQALIGKKVGDEVELPGVEEGDPARKFRVAEIGRYVDLVRVEV